MVEKINACFISYRHPGDKGADKYVQVFVEKLRKELRFLYPQAEIFFDEDRLGIGDFFNTKLAHAICCSACMVIFYSPCYFDPQHPYCAMEYRAMLDLETARKENLKKIGMSELQNEGLIFPVVFRGSEYLPDEIKSSRQFENLEEIILCEADFNKRRCLAIIKNLAKRIFKCYRALHKANCFANIDCTEFKLPEKDTIMPWINEVAALPNMPGR